MEISYSFRYIYAVIVSDVAVSGLKNRELVSEMAQFRFAVHHALSCYPVGLSLLCT